MKKEVKKENLKKLNDEELKKVDGGATGYSFGTNVRSWGNAHRRFMKGIGRGGHYSR